MQTLVKLIIILFSISFQLRGQNSEIKKSIDLGELKMTFPSIYFKHNSTDYATMPYTVDSSLKYIVDHVKDINSWPIWRDSSEKEQLTNERIKKLQIDLSKYKPSRKIFIKSMRKAQKIAQWTIYKGTDSLQIQYLLSLNSVFDVSGMIKPKEKPYKSGFEIYNFYTMRRLHKIGTFRSKKKQAAGKQ